MKEHKVFVTEDGERFESESEALRHEHMIAVEEEIRAFLVAQEVNTRRATEYARIILAWEARKIGDAQERELTAVA